jgi:hypothetical protein
MRELRRWKVECGIRVSVWDLRPTCYSVGAAGRSQQERTRWPIHPCLMADLTMPVARIYKVAQLQTPEQKIRRIRNDAQLE